MIHIETGIAYANNKPVVVLVQEGTNVGTFIPNITQYITLNGQSDDFSLIFNLLNTAYLLAKGLKDKKVLNTVGKVVVGGLAVYGTYKLLQATFEKNKTTDSDNPTISN